MANQNDKLLNKFISTQSKINRVTNLNANKALVILLRLQEDLTRTINEYGAGQTKRQGDAGTCLRESRIRQAAEKIRSEMYRHSPAAF